MLKRPSGKIATALLFSLLGMVLCFSVAQGAAGDSQKKKILVVMSYHEDYPWHVETREGIESVLGDAEISYFYMDSKNNPDGSAERGKVAYELFQQLQPDAVIAAEDHAQELFVVPFLMNKVKTPVIFCGVNDDAGKYGYPAENVTGILEKKHYRESINLAQLIQPQIRKFAVLYRETPSNATNLAQLEKEQKLFNAELVTTARVSTAKELGPVLQSLASKADALLVLNLSGLPGEGDEPLSSAETTALVNRFWQKPTIGVSSWEVEEGILCAVAKLGQEQGAVAGQLALQAMSGTPAGKLPITQNRNGRRVINVSTAKTLGISLKPIALIGAELVK